MSVKPLICNVAAAVATVLSMNAAVAQRVPSLVKESIPKADADGIKKKLEEAGATAEIK